MRSLGQRNLLLHTKLHSNGATLVAFVIGVTLLFTSLACRSQAPAKVDLKTIAPTIQSGMPRSAIVSMLGQPESEEKYGQGSILFYGDESDPHGALIVHLSYADTVNRWTWHDRDETILSELVWLEQRTGKKYDLNGRGGSPQR